MDETNSEPPNGLLRGRVTAHLARLTLPSIGGALAIMVFNITDTWFVSRLGTDELAAMGFTFAVVMIVGALSIGFATGASSIIARSLGAGDVALARRTVTDGLFLTVAVTVLVSAAGYLTIDPLFRLLGAEGRVLALVTEYMQIWYVGAVAAIMPPVSDSCLRAKGDMIRPLLVMCTCAGVNLVLDPIMIFGWGPVPAMGLRGAALATIIARVLGMSASLTFLHRRHGLIDFTLPHLCDLLRSWRDIVKLGVPAAVTQALNPLAQGIYFRLAVGVGGVQAVAALSCATRIESFALILSFAYGIALVPFVGQNYGAKAHDRVEEARRINGRFAIVYAAVTLLVLLAVGRFLSSLFSPDPDIVRMSAIYLAIAALGHAGIHSGMWASQMLNVIGRPRPVLVISLLRVFVFVIPLSYAGSRLFGFTGLVVGLALGNLLSGIQAHLSARRVLSRQRRGRQRRRR